jgi:acyl carrier protein
VNRDQAAALVADVLGGIAPEIDVAGVDPTATLVEDLDLDSIDFLNLVAGVAERTGREIPERDYPRLATLAGFAAYLAEPVP